VTIDGTDSICEVEASYYDTAAIMFQKSLIVQTPGQGQFIAGDE
jgi:hypothetical protein